MTRPRPFAPMRRLLALVALFAIVFTACGDDGDSSAPSADASASATTGSSTSAAPKDLVVAWTGDLNSMDPPFSSVEWNRELSVNVYEPLVQYKLAGAADGSLVWDGLAVAPGLAESWTVNGAAVTFKLRSGVKFYPSGNPLTADDVKYSFERTVAVPGGFGKFNANLAGIFDPTKQIEVIDPLTVKITYTNATGTPILLPASLPSMRFPQFGILDSKAVKAKAKADDPWAVAFLKENVVGTGPYYVSARTAAKETVLETVPGYWGTQPAYSKVTLRVTGSADIAALMKGGDVDLSAVGLTPRAFDDLSKSSFTVINQPIPNIVRADLALDEGPLANVKVRQAIAYAMPYDQILKVAFFGRGVRANSYINPQSPGVTKSFDKYTTDTAKAKALLTEAGVSGGFDLPLFYDSGIVYNEDVALLIKDALGAVGIKVTLNPQPTTQFAEQRTARIAKKESSHKGMILQSGVIWLDDPDPNTDTWLKSTGTGNWTRYTNAAVDKLHADFRFEPDATKRNDAYKQIQEMVATDVPLIPLVVTGRTVALAKGITAMSFTADPHTRFWTLKPAG